MPIRVLIVDDQPLLRHGFGLIIGAEDDMEVVGEAGDGEQALALVGAALPDVVLMDIRMPGTDGINATRQIVAEHPHVKVILLTTFDIDEYAFGGLHAGASGFLLKNARTPDLLAGIRAVANGDAVLAPTTTRRLLDTYAATFKVIPEPAATNEEALKDLTPRERDIFAKLASGQTNQEIAANFSLSETTVKTHVTRILTKLELRDRVHVVIYAYQQRLISPSD